MRAFYLLWLPSVRPKWGRLRFYLLLAGWYLLIVGIIWIIGHYC
ncbi:hypothetical protein [Rhodothermus profundi]|uniref:Uncharacterized protein n=1 Tax=Rhodothermus profundi TaxID=633813 RepID=A0A1M6PSX1_9BACT|nr:hypothetical protein [Rhodothermus profundi]SHK10998.1 hypothetical protein SAMN04488087_0307 [Rhodothermus profundi]